MKNRQRQSSSAFDWMVERVLVIVVKAAIESVPVVGPIFVVLSVVSDAQRLHKSLRG